MGIDAGHPDKIRGCSFCNYDFDPFTDANDDYAVLEWMREHDRAGEFDTALCQRDHSMYDELFRYQIGNYARAALKVLDNDT